MRRTLFFLLLLSTIHLFAQQTPATAPARPTLRELTIENIFDPKAKLSFGGSPQGGFVWLDDKTVTWPRTDGDGKVVEQTVLDVESGATRRLFDPARLQAALDALGLQGTAKLARAKSWNLSPDHKQLLLELRDDLFLYTLDSGALTRLTSTPAAEQEPTFSPDGKQVAFVRDGNLFVVDVATTRERQLTTDGTAVDHNEILNGVLDWVYQEEVFGRGNFRAYWWSPDSTHIAFLQIDERPVKRYTVVDHVPYEQDLEVTAYPLAGDPNPLASLRVVAASGGPTTIVNAEAYGGGELIIAAVGWAPDSTRLFYQVQDREQTWLDLDSWSRSDDAVKTLFRETTKAWVDNLGDPVWMPDGSFLWLSERSGFRHLYHYDPTGKLLGQLTDGRWEVRTIHGIDHDGKWIYYSGTERSPIGGDVYRVHPDGSDRERLSQSNGTHTASFNPALTRYLDTFSDIETPPQTALFRADGMRLRDVDANPPTILRQYRTSKPEFVQVKTRDGFVMEGMLIKPPDFDPSKKYPVYEHTYSGPHAQQVVNRWGGSTYLWHQYLAQHGIVVWICDNRTASGKGAESEWPLYRNFGEVELRDLEDGLKWLTAQPGIDGTRVLLNGWSFGGFMTSYALTHSTMWSAGISGGTVADWRDYDSIYTERYMSRPQNNLDGYRKTAPRWAAANLHGRLLLLHGTIDDNVHIQNAIQFAYELQQADKPFEEMFYPKSRHGVSDPKLVKHMRDTMWRFVQSTLHVD